MNDCGRMGPALFPCFDKAISKAVLLLHYLLLYTTLPSSDKAYVMCCVLLSLCVSPCLHSNLLFFLEKTVSSSTVRVSPVRMLREERVEEGS